MTTLLDPIRIGDLLLPNRIFMAPLTRARATADTRVPTSLVREYYAQRASAGLIVSEATSVTPAGVGYERTPGIWSAEQVAGWRGVTEAVHDRGGRIFLQLWHVGRVSDPSLLGGDLPVGPSAIAPAGNVSLLRPKRPYVTPRALATEELAAVVEAFGQGAANARAAGFDGVEIHGANGYLIDQFLQDGSNRRTDRYGGSIENRARLLLQIVDACIGVWGASRVAVHLAPRGDAHSMGDSAPLQLFSYVARQLGQRKLAFLCAREHAGEDRIGPQLRQAFGGPFVANEGFDADTARRDLAAGNSDAIAFGKLFIANPDLPRRLAAGAPLNVPDPARFYEGGAAGYTDYPDLDQVLATS
ncbi:N-ethylmaleimide reductase [Burkholderiales bacterium]|nr:N-ethylmaleimide reductase [Burkholderiales bacterium]